ncbi:prolyl endopeptidase-like [Penaeus japonicus]|uniref:prolyl endopeptidase-like n=1 Tax=Penaeus japonicus TaxID=27405 RepID=UPI001C715DDA|nr:prolyl endopeptidase-like [Penaeus japonicus]
MIDRSFRNIQDVKSLNLIVFISLQFNKQNVFDNFQAAAEYMISEGYTSNRCIILQESSSCTSKGVLTIPNIRGGGVDLTGACINQRPDLFGAAIAQVGVMDMLRFHKFTFGYAWCSELGNPDEKEYFENILKYSPLHNLITEMQQSLARTQLRPIRYISVLTKAGHGIGKPTAKLEI